MPEIDPHDILSEVDPLHMPSPEPPSVANYRNADISGISCASCAKFNYGGVVDEGEGIIPVGTCDLWESQVRGDFVSDGYAESTPPVTDGGEDWNFADDRVNEVNEVHLSDTDQAEDDGFVYKEILRTGEWPAIPTKGGLINRNLRVVRDGASDRRTGTISMKELLDNFHAEAIPNVQIPLSDDDEDHKNTTAVNTGFIRDLYIRDDEDGISKLVAKMEFTEPEVREKVLRGTYADVSCGIPWGVSSRGKKFGTVLEHCAITNQPFIDKLGPFMAASNKAVSDQAEFIHFGDVLELEPTEVTEETAAPPVLSLETQRSLVAKALADQLNLTGGDYEVRDIEGNVAVIGHEISKTSWKVPMKIVSEERIHLASVPDWVTIEEEVEQAEEPPVESTPVDKLELARRLRGIRLSQGNSNSTKEGKMPLSREDLERLELSDSARAAFQEILDENSELRSDVRESEVEARVTELSDQGLKGYPGALKLYRSIALADDEGAAVVLLSDKGDKQHLTALQILDQFIDAIKSEDKILLSDQQTLTNDEKPPANADGEVEISEEDRFAQAKAALYGQES